ncbi:hypothetical protein IEO21_09090 [Rhodonia placenta]|uniref:NYN domain-containing protein n=1 Tax=Rhodonia placenta TaxID=104341 RepID=A0A8H7NUX3_9APHY|nr:hypothetical protein IEO21_09090 [Postia placenta]
MTDHEPNVAIFWDYENCTPPSVSPGYDIVDKIRQIAHEYGSVKLFKAYLQISEQLSSNSNRLRSELQSCGVSLTDCPHNGRKDVADKMMIGELICLSTDSDNRDIANLTCEPVDMLMYAIDTPAPATLIVISGDRDFVYAVSMLRWRKYRVVVVVPSNSHPSMRSQASTVLDWEVDVLKKAPKSAPRRFPHVNIPDPASTIASTHRRTQSAAPLMTPATVQQSLTHDVVWNPSCHELVWRLAVF